MRKYTYVLPLSILFVTIAYGQSTIDLSKNLADKKINVPGTYLSLDTIGLNLQATAKPGTYINENDLTVFSAEQKQVSIEDYKSIIGQLHKFDSVILENNVIFNEYTGKFILGEIYIQNVNKEVWMCYLGNQEFVIEIKGFYNSDLKLKYRASFESVIKSLFIDSNRKISLYEDLPFYLDEGKFLYKRELSFMPESIALSQEIDGNNRTITIAHFDSSKEEIKELKEEYISDSEKLIIDEKEIFLKVYNADSRIRLDGIIILNNRVIIMDCMASIADEKAIDEFKEIAKSIEFK